MREKKFDCSMKTQLNQSYCCQDKINKGQNTEYFLAISEVGILAPIGCFIWRDIY